MSLSEQKKKFADEYVFQYFHHSAVTPECYIAALTAAKYTVTGDHAKDDLTVRNLLADELVTAYIENEIERFREILSDNQSRGLWKHISDYEVQESDDSALAKIYVH